MIFAQYLRHRYVNGNKGNQSVHVQKAGKVPNYEFEYAYYLKGYDISETVFMSFDNSVNFDQLIWCCSPKCK